MRIPRWTAREWPQFKILVRKQVRAFLENDFTGSGADRGESVVNIVALLAGFGVTFTTLLVFKYFFGLERLTLDMREAMTWPDKEFLLSSAMLVTLFGNIFCWDALFPDTRDVMALAHLPLGARTLMLSRAASVCCMQLVLFTGIVAIPAVVFPVFMLSEGTTPAGYVRYVMAHLASSLGAGAFTFLGLAATQSLLTCTLPSRFWRRASVYVQFAFLFSALAAFAFFPRIAAPELLRKPENLETALLYPQYWFLGLYEFLLGSNHAFVPALASRAVYGLAAACSLVVLLYPAAFQKRVSAVMEDSEFLAHHSISFARLFRRVGEAFLRHPRERAIFHFTARAMKRSPRSRLWLAAYVAVGVVYVLGDVGNALWHAKPDGAQPPAEFLMTPLVLMFFSLVGMRTLFAAPVEPGANWVFRVTEARESQDYFRGVRKLMYVAGVLPFLAVGAVAISALYSGGAALKFLCIAPLTGMLLVEYMTKDLARIPFTCTPYPGKANLKLRLGVYAIFFLAATAFLTVLIRNAFESPRFLAFLSIIALLSFGRRAQLRRRSESQPGRLTYVEQPDWLTKLELEAPEN